MNIPDTLGHLLHLVNVSNSLLIVLKRVGGLQACLSQEPLVIVSFATGLMMFPCTATRKMAAFDLQIFQINGERNGVRAIAALGPPEQNLGFDRICP